MNDAQPLSSDQRNLVRSGQRVVTDVTRRVAKRFAIDQGVLLGVAHEALIAAARTYDPEHGVAFEAHAFTRVYGETFDFAKQERSSAAVTASKRLRRFGLAAADAIVDVGDALHDDDEALRRRIDDECARIEVAVLAAFGGFAWPAADERLAARDIWRATSTRLADARSALPAPQRALLELHYDAGEKLVVAAAKLGMSYRTAKRHHRAALDALRLAFEQTER